MLKLFTILLASITGLIAMSACSNLSPEEIKSVTEYADNYVHDIDIDSRIDSLVLKDEEVRINMTFEGCVLTGFFSAKKLVKFTFFESASSGYRKRYYYFEEGELIFVRQIEDNYAYDEASQSFDLSNITRVYEAEYYYYENSIINQIVSGEKQIPEPTVVIDEDLFRDEARKYSLKLKAKKGIIKTANPYILD